MMNEEELKTVVDLLKQAYMEEDWKLVLESVEILTSEEEDYQRDNNNLEDTEF